MEVIAHIGARIAQARREKGLTEDQLAAATHFSVSLVRHFEQGTKPTSHAFTTPAARELGVQLGWLLGQEQVHRQHQEDDNTVAPALRAAMDAYDDPQLPGDVRPLSDLESVFASAERLWRAGRYDRLITVLPELLRHLYSHAQDQCHVAYFDHGVELRFPGSCRRGALILTCLLYTSPSPRDRTRYRMPSSA